MAAPHREDRIGELAQAMEIGIRSENRRENPASLKSLIATLTNARAYDRIILL